MKRLLVLFITISGQAIYAQDVTDTLSIERKIFHSTAYQKGKTVNNAGLFQLYSKSKAYDGQKQLLDAKILMPVGAGVTAAGLALTVQALIGKKQVRTLDQVQYTYYKRPVINLLAGVGLIAGGFCLMEWGNDKKNKSVHLFNMKKKHDATHTEFGLNSEGHLRLKHSF
jgi:hypothetical protein